MLSILSIPFMTPLETGEVEADIYAVRSRQNDAFVIKSKSGLIAIDSGSLPSELTAGFEKRGLELGDVTDVFLTHSDSDHIGGLELFPNAKIYISRRELADGGDHSGDGRIKSVRKSSFHESVTTDRLHLPDGGETFEVGGHRIECIPAPGHSPGSLAYLLDDSVLFCGDAFRIKDGKPVVHPLTEDKAAALETIKKLMALGVGKLICTSRYGLMDSR
jgi:glyoxylase-like metal-dependent hydrolase (beta-lactamase superfamily II)